jgi:hypothetical protein
MHLFVGNGICVSCNGNILNDISTSIVTVKYMIVTKVKKKSEKT